MGTAPIHFKVRYLLAMFVVLAAPTNHSLGDVVYKKVERLDVRTVASAPDFPTHSESAGESAGQELPGYRIVRLLPSEDGLKALIEGGEDKGILPGTVLKAQRPIVTQEGVLDQVPTALLKTQEVRDTYTIAEVTMDGSLDSQMHFLDYPELMVGDRVIPESVQIASRTQLAPTVSLTYKQLFVDPKSQPADFELTPEGRDLLLERVAIFRSMRAPMLMIEAYTDPQGERSANQMESYQRALTIRQTLIDELGFDANRLVAIGMGESEAEQDSEAFLPGAGDAARRVVIKVKSLPQIP